MKRLLNLGLLLTLGLAVGAGSAYGAAMLLAPSERAQSTNEFVETGPVLAPLVLDDGRLSGYASFEIQLEVPVNQVDFVRARILILHHAINLRTLRRPLASGPDGMLPNLEQFRKVVMSAAPEAFGDGVVRHAAITQASPA